MDYVKQKQIQRHFEGMYQAGQKPWVDHGAEHALNEFFKILKQKYPKARLLDIGCGNGWISIRAAQNGHEVWGIDSSPTAIGEAKESAAREGVDKNVHFQLGDALNLPYRNNFFNALIDRGLFHHILPQNRPVYLKNLLRVLSSGGLMYLSVFSTRNPLGIGQLFSKDLIVKIFDKHFKIIGYSQDDFELPAHLLHFILERKQSSPQNR